MKLPPKRQIWRNAARIQRRHKTPEKDQRREFEVDRDRIQYSTAFHRLAGVTQIVRAGEAGVFHTRQQHTYKVAQIGRRLAQYCLTQDKRLAVSMGIHPEVVEAACLAHDLGHPPFGHAGEHVLNDLVENKGDADGFEGNAQTFRVITKLAVRFPETHGLDLTRATLAACLKYPWLRDSNDPDRSAKWGAYRLDKADFEFATQGLERGKQTLEAALMDWADDISYSVHDLEDFHRVGAIPWSAILYGGDQSEIVNDTHRKWHGAPSNAGALLNDAFERLSQALLSLFGPLLLTPYEGTREQRVALRNLSSSFIGRFLKSTKLTQNGLQIDSAIQAEVRLLKHIARRYIISSPSLKAQQHGQKEIVEDVFGLLFEESGKTFPPFLPTKLRYIWELSEGQIARFCADCIASMTEAELVGLHRRLTGSAAGSVLDPIVR